MTYALNRSVKLPYYIVIDGYYVMQLEEKKK